MISFTCGGCGKNFSVRDEFAGRRARCKICGATVEVPKLDGGAARASAPANSLNVEAPAGGPVEHQSGNGEAVVNSIAGRAAAANVGSVSTTSMGNPAARIDASAPTTAAVSPPAPAPKIPVRIRRLLAEAEQMRSAFEGSELIKVASAEGSPPEIYQIEYSIRSLESMKGEKAVYRQIHRVEIRLTSDYPRLSPSCRMLTPVFHPNIDSTTICVGDHWTAGEKLTDLVVRIGEMLAYQAYNIKSPLNAEAAMWADLNAEKLPTDSRTVRPGEATK